MEFFDKKEEVLEIKLTPFGTYKLSQGNFTPEYYSFFDTGIIYDSLFAASGGFSEKQNDIEDRITLNTPSMKPLRMNSGISSSQWPANQQLRNAIGYVGNVENPYIGLPGYAIPASVYNSASIAYPADNFLLTPIGTSKLSSKYLPSWDVRMLQGFISSSVPMYSGSLTAPGVTASIPQINITYACGYYVSQIEGYISTDDSEDFMLTEPTDTNNLQAITTNIFPDGTYITVDRRDLVVSLRENNADFFKENFDIEVFVSDDDSDTWRQLLINNDPTTPYNSDDAQYYLTLNADRQMDTALIDQLRVNDDIAFNSIVGSNAGISTREYFIRDLCNPEPELCEP